MVRGDAMDGESQWTPDGPALLIGKSSYSKSASPVSPEGFSDEGLSGREAFLDKNAWWAVAGRPMSSCFPAQYAIMNGFVKEHWPPAVLISVHSDVQVQPSDLHKEYNHMHIDA